jgi:hypothetical protein
VQCGCAERMWGDASKCCHKAAISVPVVLGRKIQPWKLCNTIASRFYILFQFPKHITFHSAQVRRYNHGTARLTTMRGWGSLTLEHFKIFSSFYLYDFVDDEQLNLRMISFNPILSLSILFKSSCYFFFQN